MEDQTRIALWSIGSKLSTIDAAAYRDWIATHATLSDAERGLIARRIKTLRYRPLVSLVLAETWQDDDLRDSLGSVAAQIYSNVETIVVAQSLRIEAVRAVAAEVGPLGLRLIVATAPEDARAVDAENAGLGVASGDFVAFLSSGDRLAAEALAEMVFALERRPKTLALYSDEDWIDATGVQLMPRFKTGWDPDAHLGFDLMGRLCLMRRDAVVGLGGLRPDRAPASHYDLHSRIAANAGPSRIIHIPAVLYHRKAPPAAAADAQEETLAAYAAAARWIATDEVRRTEGVTVEVRPAPAASYLNRIVWPLPDPAPLVSVLVPTRDKAVLLRNCARGVLEATAYPGIEFLVLDNGSTEIETLALFEELQCDARVRVLPMPGPFNYSKLNNDGVAAALGEIIVLLNNDIEVIDRGWLREMVSLAVRPEIGCVGAKLLYGDRRIQHAGIVLAPGPLAAHVFRLHLPSDLGYDAQLASVRSYLAVTAACLVMRKAVFEEVGCFDEAELKIAYNDVDLCLQICDYGYRVVCTPFAELLHLESASRGSNQTPEEIGRERAEQAILAARWAERFHSDPFHNPNILHDWTDGLCLAAPRRGKPWLIGSA